MPTFSCTYSSSGAPYPGSHQRLWKRCWPPTTGWLYSSQNCFTQGHAKNRHKIRLSFNEHCVIIFIFNNCSCYFRFFSAFVLLFVLVLLAGVEFVHVLVDGKIAKTGCGELALELEKVGYEEIGASK